MIKKKKLFIVLIIISFLIILLVSISSANAASLYGFDIMETFDDLQDWKGTAWKSGGGQIGIENYPNDLPKKIDGSPSIWTGYAHWASTDNGDFWIKNHGVGKVWGGTGKSMCIDLTDDTSPNVSQKCGPDRFVVYFGDGTRTSGYNEVYIFFMARIYPNQWPTECRDNQGNLISCSGGGPVGYYINGSSYDFWAGWKFAEISHGFVKTWQHGDPILCPKQGYGCHAIVPKIKSFAYGNYRQPELLLTYNDYINGDGFDDHYTNHFSGPAIPTNDWFGVEFRFKIGTPGKADGEATFWIYDSKGNATQVLNINNAYFQNVQLAGDKFNKFVIGGNNANSYVWGSTMNANYYIDDVIINGSRIGPKYFQIKLGSLDTIPPAPPSALR